MDIWQAIEERQKQIKRLEQEITTLQVAAKLLTGDTKTEKPQTQPDMANAVLEEVGKSMHVTQIAAQIKKKFGKTVKSNNLGVMLFRYAKRGNRFYKVKGRPNTYGLIKWQDLVERIEAANPRNADAVGSAA